MSRTSSCTSLDSTLSSLEDSATMEGAPMPAGEGGSSTAATPLLRLPSEGAAAESAAEAAATRLAGARVAEWEEVLRSCREDEAHPPAPLTFESRFECGNLCSAVRVGAREYELALEPDINNGSNHQWFFFRVQGMEGARGGAEGGAAPAPFVFHLVNMDSGGSVFLAGQRPWVYFEGEDSASTSSSASASPSASASASGGSSSMHPGHMPLPAPQGMLPPPVLPGVGWRRAGEEVVYHRNTYRRNKTKVVPCVWAPAQGAQGAESSSSGGSSSSSGGSSSGGGAVALDGLFSQYTHSWRISFPRACNTAWFAYCLPYTYSDLQWDVQRWEARAQRVCRGMRVCIGEEEAEAPQRACAASLGQQLPVPASLKALGYTLPLPAHALGLPSPAAHAAGAASTPQLSTPLGTLFECGILHRTVLCHSLAGNPLPLLTITQFSDGPAAVAARPYIVLSARVHPGESNASWTLRAVVDTLTSSCPLALELRRRAIFKVVPMLNPDGVINGCHRLNLAGVDLNRHWSTPTLDTAPTIWHMRALIMTLQRRAAATSAAAAAGAAAGAAATPAAPTSQPILLYADFHGHSRRRNTFTFGCPELPEASAPGTLPPDYLRALALSLTPRANLGGKLLPKLLAARSETFLFSSCDWTVGKDKLSTARVAMWRDALLPAATTLEMGFSGPTAGPRAGVHNSGAAYSDVGVAFCLALLDLLQGPEGARQAAAVEALRGAGGRVGRAVKGSSSGGGGSKGGGKGGRARPKVADVAVLIFSGPAKRSAGGGAGADAAQS